MGYRSDVLIRMSCDDVDEFEKILAKLMLESPPWWEVVQTMIKDFEIHEFSKEGIKLYAEDWKWYEGYDGVDACMKMVDYFQIIAEENKALDTCFIRVGEEATDIDERYENDGCELGNITREINF